MDHIIGQTPPGNGTAAQAPPAGAMIVDGDQKTFMSDVIEASRTSRTGGFLGDLVRSLQALTPRWRRWCGRRRPAEAGQDRYRRQSLPGPATHPAWAAAAIGARPSLRSGRARSPTCSRARSPNPRCGGLSRIAEAGRRPMPPPICWPRPARRWRRATPRRRRTIQYAGEEEPENGDAWGGLIRALMAVGEEDQARKRWRRFPKSWPTIPRFAVPAARWPWRRKAVRRRANWRPCKAGSRPTRTISRATISPPR